MNIANPVGDIDQAKFPITSGYGMRFHPIEQINLMHYGIDIAAPQGTNVRAADTGTVTHSYNSNTGGNIIRIAHPNGFTTTYMHLFHRHVAKNETVLPGDIIGAVGMTGGATGPHLHFEIKDSNGQRFDPKECYLASIFISPYPYTPTPEEEEIHVQKKVPDWVWVVGGSALAIGITAIIIGATREKRA